MTQVADQAAEAFINDRKLTSGNTKVLADASGTTLTLYGHIIARRLKQANGSVRIELSDAGYQTNTTKDRLNGVLSHFGYKVYQRKGIWYIAAHGDSEGAEWHGQVTLIDGEIVAETV